MEIIWVWIFFSTLWLCSFRSVKLYFRFSLLVISTDYTRTLPNPKRLNKNVTIQENRTMDDHMLVSNGLYIPSPSPASSLVIKGNYIPSPSPAPPTDGSYFNMSDKYLSYPPIVSMFPSNLQK